MKVAFNTLGCKVNQYDTQAMQALFEGEGFETVSFSEVADVYVINTCSVTQVSDKKSRQMISRAHAKNPEAIVIAAGCYVQRAPEEIGQLPGVSMLMGVQDRAKVVSALRELLEAGVTSHTVSDVQRETEYEELAATTEGRTRAYLKIQDGCDRYCAYCIIPYVRGPVRSRKLENIQQQLQALAEAGFCEVVLTGIHLLSYGKDFRDGTDITHVLALAEEIPGIQRVRLGSLEPQLLSGAFIAAVAGSAKVCRQFHLSLQSGSAGVLERMRRRYTPEEYFERAQRLKEAVPGCAITTDIIAGFPGETDAEFEETLRFVEEVAFSRIHVFPFSRREGTLAYDMPNQVPQKVKLERVARLIALGGVLERQFLEAQVGSVQSVLLEEEVGGALRGYTDTYADTHVANGPQDALGKVLRCTVTGVTDSHLDGIILEEL